MVKDFLLDVFNDETVEEKVSECIEVLGGDPKLAFICRVNKPFEFREESRGCIKVRLYTSDVPDFDIHEDGEFVFEKYAGPEVWGEEGANVIKAIPLDLKRYVRVELSIDDEVTFESAGSVDAYFSTSWENNWR